MALIVDQSSFSFPLWIDEVNCLLACKTKNLILTRAVIRQTASKFAINIEFEDSKSESTYAAVIRSDKLSTFELNYQYINRPFPPAVTAMNIHHGTASVLISEDLQTMEGEYYTGRGRVRHGSIKLMRE